MAAQPPRRTALPMPDALATAGPGLYALIATPGDGTPGDGAAAVQMILRTDLAPTVWRGSDGLTVQVRGYSDAQPRAGVTLRTAGEEQRYPGRGHHRCRGRRPVSRAAAARRGTAGAPRVLHAFGARGRFRCPGPDIAPPSTCPIAAWRAMPHRGRSMPTSGWIAASTGQERQCRSWRCCATMPAGRLDIPATVDRRAGRTGRCSWKQRRRAPAEASHPSAGDAFGRAPRGHLEVEVHGRSDARHRSARRSFRVDAFVPDRMAVEIGPAAGGDLCPGSRSPAGDARGSCMAPPPPA